MKLKDAFNAAIIVTPYNTMPDHFLFLKIIYATTITIVIIPRIADCVSNFGVSEPLFAIQKKLIYTANSIPNTTNTGIFDTSFNSSNA